MRRRSSAILIALFVLVLGMQTTHAFAGVLTDSQFEVDGNLRDNVGSGVDWSALGLLYTPYTDETGTSDGIFGGGSKELQPGAWSCPTSSAPSKDDILNGGVAFRRLDVPVGGKMVEKQFMYVHFFRASGDGDAHMDYEFNSSGEPNASCPSVPQRSNNDLVVTFDTESKKVNGRMTKVITVRAFRWEGSSTSGTLKDLGLAGTFYAGAVNIPTDTTDPALTGREPGTFGEAVINLTDSPIGEFDCNEFARTYMKTRASTSISAEIKDRTAPVGVNTGYPKPDFLGSKAGGAGFGAHVVDTDAGVDQGLIAVSSEATPPAPASDSASDQVAGVQVPLDSGEDLTAAVISAATTSGVDKEGYADQTSVAQAVDVNLVQGLLTADLVTARASTGSSGLENTVSVLGSGFQNLKVDFDGPNGDEFQPALYTNVSPGQRIDLPAALYGQGSYIVLYERTLETTRPDPGQREGGMYSADVAVNMIRLHIHDRYPAPKPLLPLPLPLLQQEDPHPGDQTVDISVGKAVAHSQFKQLYGCPPIPGGVSAGAFVAQVSLTPLGSGTTTTTTVGPAGPIPADGGTDHQNLGQMAIQDPRANGPVLVRFGSAASDAAGSLSRNGANQAAAYASLANICVLPLPNGQCTVSASALRAESLSSATSSGASSDDGGTSLAGVTVMGQSTNVGPDPVVIQQNMDSDPEPEFLIALNEQECDNGIDLADGCNDTVGGAGLRVRLIHIIVMLPDNPLGLNAGTELIVGFAHTNARRA